MIYGDPYMIGVQLELVAIYSCEAIKYGMFNFVIDGELIPGKGILLDFYNVIEVVKDNLEQGMAKKNPDIGSISLEQLDFSEGEPQNVIYLGAGHLYDVGCCCWLGFDGDEERFFYTTDYEKSIQEKRYPRGTIEELIRGLPKIEEILFCSKEAVRIFTHFKLSHDKKYKSSMPTLKGGNHGLLDEFGNEWLDYTHGDTDKIKWNVMLTPKWQRKFGWPSIALEHFRHYSGTKVLSGKTGRRVGLYCEVEIVAGESIEEAYRGYIGRKGVVLGLSEAEGVVHGYGVYFRDDNIDEFLAFAVDEVIATGIRFEREAFYDGSYACLSPERELLNLHVAGARNQHEKKNSESQRRGGGVAADTPPT